MYENHGVSVYFDDERVLHRKKRVMTPGEMEQVLLNRELLTARPHLQSITLTLEEEKL